MKLTIGNLSYMLDPNDVVVLATQHGSMKIPVRFLAESMAKNQKLVDFQGISVMANAFRFAVEPPVGKIQ